MSNCPFCALTVESVAKMTDDEATRVYLSTPASIWCDAHATSAFKVGDTTSLAGRALVAAIIRYVER